MTNNICVKISGLNLIRIIDKLVLNNVYVSNLVTKNKYIKFVISEDKLYVLDKICKKEHKFYKIIYKSGIKQVFSRIPYMLGTILALILTYSYIFSFSLFINSVNLTYSSNLTYDLTKVNNLLTQNGITSGMMKNKFKVKEIQNLIMLEIDDVEGCEVKYSGNNLNICIYPAVNKYEVGTENIYSSFDAVVESATAYSGVLKVKKGDIVKVGDLLIENDGGASGEVKGKVYFSGTKIYNENQQKIIYTGNEFVSKEYKICNKFTVFDKNKCNFNKYLVENCSFFVSKNLFIPIVCNKIIYKEIEIEDVIIPFESVEEDIKNEAYLEAKSKVQDEKTITNITYSIVKENNYTRVDCFIETVINLF